ncbi:hypothetical protein AKJ18_16240 [Vibrio xuii]|nr:hypothetical protein AKJ18_16240 [Vibrio xuii]
MTTLNFTISVDGLNSDTFVVREFQGTETLSHHHFESGEICNGYHYDIELASRRPDLWAPDVVDKPVQLTLYRNGEVSRRVHGIVKSFSKGDTGHHHTFYRLTLVPALERLSLRHNCRIFQLKSVPEIISILLQEMKIEDFAFSLKNDYSQREFCVQYRETDLAFLQRLAAEEGLNYSFAFKNGQHTLLFSDDSSTLPNLAIPVSFNSLGGGTSDTPYVSDFEVSASVQSSHVTTRDRSFIKPRYSFQQHANTSDPHQQDSIYEHFDAPGRFKDDQSGQKFTQTRLEYLRRDAHLAKGASNVPMLQAGYQFELQDHFDDTINQNWVIISVHHRGTQPQALEEEAGLGATTYSNTFSVIPSQYNWQPEPELKPLIHGPMMATVVGPENEEIYCDDYGRVKVQFPWDRYSNGDEHSSCWIRVSQTWAGSQYGAVAIPRIGHEVIIEFLNGDPDQPIITGRTYHFTNTLPYPLPEHKSKTVIRTETHQGEGFNELSFEDQSGQEQIYLHAQKDWDSQVNNDSTLDIKHDKHLTIQGTQRTHVLANQHQTVEGDERTKVTKDQTLVVEGSLHLKTGSVWVNDSGSEIHVKAGNKVVIEAGSEITLKAAGSFVKVDPAGVHLVGAGVNLNSGGGAGSGSGYSGKLAELPKTHTNNTVVNELEKNAVTATKQAADANVVTELGQTAQAATTSAQLNNSSTNDTTPSPAEAANEESQALRLKSPTLKQSLTLDKLANRDAPPYKKGVNGQEVAYIQQALIKLGFDLGKFGADGDYGSTTERQIKLFQENYTPTNKTHLAYDVGAVDGITGQGTILGLDEALVEGWEYDNDEMDLKWLIVPKGQLTFDAEGNDIRGSLHFSRTIHWPGNAKSGVTIGRGYDCGNRSKQEIYSDLTSSGVEIETASAISQSAGLKGNEAKLFVEQHGKGINDITRKDQYNLFKLVYPQYEKRASTNYEKWTSQYKDTRVAWVSLDSKIRDVLVDFVYQGFTKGPRPMTKGMSNDKEILIEYIEKSSVLSSYEPGRQRANYLRN